MPRNQYWWPRYIYQVIKDLKVYTTVQNYRKWNVETEEAVERRNPSVRELDIGKLIWSLVILPGLLPGIILKASTQVFQPRQQTLWQTCSKVWLYRYNVIYDRLYARSNCRGLISRTNAAKWWRPFPHVWMDNHNKDLQYQRLHIDLPASQASSPFSTSTLLSKALGWALIYSSSSRNLRRQLKVITFCSLTRHSQRENQKQPCHGKRTAGRWAL